MFAKLMTDFRLPIKTNEGENNEVPTFLAVAVLTLASLNHVSAQNLPAVPPEMDILKKDVGEWDCEIKLWQGPGEPAVSKGSESSRMLGGFWLITNFKGNMMGLDFQGHGTYGYDPEKKQYVGTWMDSVSPTAMHMVGSYDKESKTLSFVGKALGPDMKTMAKHTLSTSYKDGKRVMSMLVHPEDGEEFKMMEIIYTKKKSKTEK